MRERHFSWRLFEEILASGGGPERLEALFDLLLKHLLKVCPECRRGAEEAVDSAEARLLELHFEPTLEAARREAARLREELDAAAEADFARLLKTPPDERRAVVRRAVKRYRNPRLVLRLVDACRDRLGHDPREAAGFARLAVDVALKLPATVAPEGVASDLLIRARANLGNALRACGELTEAEQFLERAALDARACSPDPLIHGEVLRLLATLRKNQRRFEEAEQHADEALRIYREDLGDLHLTGRTLLTRAEIHYYAGRPATAVADLEEAVTLLQAERDPRLLICARHNLAAYLLDLERLDEAEAMIRSLEPEDWNHALRLLWLDGRLALARGQSERALALLEQVQKSFAGKEMAYDAALVGLDLAVVLVHRRETARVRELAAEVTPIFLNAGIRREAMAAVLLFHRAAEAENVTLALIEKLASYFRRNLVLGLEEPS